MIKLRVHTNDFPFYVLSSEIRQQVTINYPDDIKRINSVYADMIACSSARVLQRDPLIVGIYPHDVAKIFNKLKIDVEFVDENNNVLFIDATLSGLCDL